MIRPQDRNRRLYLRQLKVHCARRRDQRAMLCRDVSGVLSSRRRDDTYRRAFQARFYRRAHGGTERLVRAVR